jgi:hypothetical protein
MHFDWDFGDTRTRADGLPIVSHVYAIGTYTPTVTARNHFSRATTSAHVEARLPIDSVALARSFPTELGKPTAFTATITPQQPATYTWSFGDGTVSRVTSVGTLTRTFARAGSYAVRVDAEDDVSSVWASTTAEVDARITEPRLLVASPVGRNVTTALTATVSTGTRLRYEWDFDDNSPLVTTQVAIASHVYTVTGVFTPMVKMSNTLGDERATARLEVLEPIQQVQVTNTSPADAGQPVTFTVTVVPAGPATYTWDWDDGSTCITQSNVVTHIYHPACSAITTTLYTAAVEVYNLVSSITETSVVTITLNCDKRQYLPIVRRQAGPSNSAKARASGATVLARRRRDTRGAVE